MSPRKSAAKTIGILTAGGDCPGLNAAIRAITKASILNYGIEVIGILDGFRGLVDDRMRPLSYRDMSGMLALGGTILGTSRDKPRKMHMGHKIMDMTETAVNNARSHGIDCLVCLGGGGTQKNALHLAEAGLNVITLPKTIDNDIGGTDISFGFDTAVSIATEAIDRLHTTATSHDRIIVVETMGHRTGWIALGSGIAGGADVILIPEIPYEIEAVAAFLLKRQRRYGKKFSIVAVAEGSLPRDDSEASKAHPAQRAPETPKSYHAQTELDDYQLVREPLASRLARQIQLLTKTEARVTSLGHIQRGGTPSSTDRLLATNLGTKTAELLADGHYNVMVAVRGGHCIPIPLAEVAGVRKSIPMDHPWLKTALLTATNLGLTKSALRNLIGA